MREKVILCAIRTLGVLATFVVFVVAAKYLELDYSDAKAVLALVNGYLPEAILLAGIGGGALVFYRMAADEDNDFKFSEFFKAGSRYDIYRFGYFWLLIIAGWTVFITAWRDKPLEALIGIVLGIFVAKAGIDSVANAMGKTRDQPPEAKP